jgi:predicted kinase
MPLIPTAFILIGPSGSGKSTYATAHMPPETEICSADDHFMRHDKYEFDPSQLSNAHGACLRRYLDGAKLAQHLCVDNTNTTIAEVAPYIAVAQAYAYNIRAIFFDTPWRVCAERSTKGIDPAMVLRMSMQAEDTIRNWPPFWPKIEVI